MKIFYFLVKIFGKCRRLLKYVIRPDDEAYKKYRHIGTTELSCRDVSFCPTVIILLIYHL